MKNKIEKALTFLEALLLGIDAKVEGATFGIVNEKLYIKMPFGDSHQLFSRDWMSLKKFIRIANRMSDQELKIMKGGILLHKTIFDNTQRQSYGLGTNRT
jgi:hypothetical protein